MMIVGRLCVKIAGRDAGKKCVIVSTLDENTVIIDGETRRRKCNILHLEPLTQTIDIKKDASHEDIVKAFKKIGVELKATKSKKKGIRPRRLRRSKLAKKDSLKVEKPVQEKAVPSDPKEGSANKE